MRGRSRCFSPVFRFCALVFSGRARVYVFFCHESAPGVKHDTLSVPVQPSANVSAGVVVDGPLGSAAGGARHGRGSPGPAAPAAPAIVQTPDPDSLRPRAEGYWRLLVSGDRFGASQFLRPEDRPAFLQGREQAFRDPVVESIALSNDGARATMEIAFDMMTPVGTFPWKIQQEWTAVDGEWMALPRQSRRQPLRHARRRSRIRT